MNEGVIVALIAFLGTLTGSLAGILTSSKLTNYRIEKLEEKVDKHNHLIERMTINENDDKAQWRKINEIDHDVKKLIGA